MSRTHTFALIALALFIHGCGGGGSDAPDPPKGPPPPPPPTYTIGGTLTGLESGTLVLGLSAPGISAQTLSLTADGDFQFSAGVFEGSDYTVAITTTPENHTCTIENASGTANSDVDDVAVDCDVIATTVYGIAQKGPFTIASAVIVHELDHYLSRTGRTVETLVTDARGSFSTNIDFVGPVVEIEVTGTYFHEHAGVVSTFPLTLRAYASRGSTRTSVNVLSELTLGRIKALVEGGMGFAEARRQARQEVFERFDIPYVADDLDHEADLLAADGGQLLLLSLRATHPSEGFTFFMLDNWAKVITEGPDAPNYTNPFSADSDLDPLTIQQALADYAAANGITDAAPAYVNDFMNTDEVWLNVEGFGGSEMTVQIDGYAPISVTEDGSYLLAEVPRTFHRSISFEVVGGPPQVCVMNPQAVSIVDDDIVTISCTPSKTHIYLVGEYVNSRLYLIETTTGRETTFEGVRKPFQLISEYPMFEYGKTYSVAFSGETRHSERCVITPAELTINEAHIEADAAEVTVSCEPNVPVYADITANFHRIQVTGPDFGKIVEPGEGVKLPWGVYVGEAAGVLSAREDLEVGGNACTVTNPGIVTDAHIEAGRYEVEVDCP